MPERPRSVLVAGAGGALGRHVVAALAGRGHEVRALIRDPSKRTLPAGARDVVIVDLLRPEGRLSPAMRGIEVVFSAVGQSVVLGSAPARAPFGEVDYPMNRALLDAALEAGVGKFVYVSVLNGPELRRLAYVEAHERFVDDLHEAPIDFTVVRANGFFHIYLEALEQARRGRALVDVGDPKARSNPIDERELAVVCAEAIAGREEAIDVGGPQVLGRREEMEEPFRALGREPRLRSVPRPLIRATLPLLRRRDPRRAEMLEFVLEVSGRDMLAPPRGESTLRAYLRAHADRGAEAG